MTGTSIQGVPAFNPKIHLLLRFSLCMVLPAILDIIRAFALLFSFAGAALLIYGGVRAAVKVLLLEFRRRPYVYTQIRNEFTSKIVFGLEFFIAADILTTIIAPTQEELLNLAVAVIIRTILGYFLQREAKEFNLE
jgi:uncharacterized membrane protein